MKIDGRLLRGSLAALLEFALVEFSLFQAAGVVVTGLRPMGLPSLYEQALPWLVLATGLAFAKRLLAGRYAPPPGSTPRGLGVVWTAALAALAAYWLFAREIQADVVLHSDVPALLMTVAVTGASAFIEEFCYRWILLGRLLRCGWPVAACIALQALTFWLAHGLAARTDTGTLSGYLLWGMVLGVLSLGRAGIWLTALLHAGWNLTLATASPWRHAYVPRFVGEVNAQWATLAQALLAASLLLMVWLNARAPSAPLPEAAPMPRT
ncbi:CPBP family intramembrane metalloprotease [Pelomonas sp. APW6]|uniref:CPBP family intramembrane metalloprotease n=1 Tax=Roseateles subflavus TaxID=3053353 RepID=A0ABT7LL75_9BURK|nr:CPBP family intramembrane glutamic endopeptidase [Pelomonas sp. APW6]MDL5033616.1 CPBP family intramembrane metalloprotease [Pelomonas sp. APW6]